MDEAKTLRDEIAIAAMTALIARFADRSSPGELASEAYRTADAMLHARAGCADLEKPPAR